ncbi:MAG: excinuclease subunit [Deltaproteobacteria bacterium]|nr:excinuclease subunit [Deltaproteobacteria bacterium]
MSHRRTSTVPTLGSNWGLPPMETITIRGARQHNLKNIDLDIPRRRLVVITGPSGSGKSSLAFDTLYAEGQRRYVESLSSYARQFLEKMDRPSVESIDGLSPAIAIEQRTASRNPRSTVGTITEIHDYLRVLFARLGQPHCPRCNRVILAMTVQEMVDHTLGLAENTRVLLLTPQKCPPRGQLHRLFARLRRQGFVRARLDGTVVDLDGAPAETAGPVERIEAVVDRLVLRPGLRQRLTDSFELALKVGDGRARLAIVDGSEWEFSEHPLCHTCDLALPEISPQLFSFNSALGACPTCSGLGAVETFDPDLVIPDPGRSLHQGAIAPWASRRSHPFLARLERLGARYGFGLSTPFKDLSPEARQLLLHGSGSSRKPVDDREGEQDDGLDLSFEGVITSLERQRRRKLERGELDQFAAYLAIKPCPACQGSRLTRHALAVTVGDINIHEASKLDLSRFRAWLDSLRFSPQHQPVADRLLGQIRQRLEFLAQVGLSYLSLQRAGHTLSGGEAQRLRLATQIGARLVGVLYVLDEPSIGLHQRDNERLLETLRDLRDLGNSVLVVEHDADTILAADHVVDMGPGAGDQGGRVIFSGPPAELLRHSDSLTGKYLSGRLGIPKPLDRRNPAHGFIAIEGATANNLADITVRIPVGLFTAVTGVSGSGKSTLILDTLYRAAARRLHRARAIPGPHRRITGLEAFERVIHVDQSAIGRTPRSNPATYTGIFSPVRDLFALVPEARARGYAASRFSFNVKGGRCEACGGDGTIKMEMLFLPDVYVTCDACKGSRFNRDTLEIRYKGETIADVLAMTVDHACHFFANVPSIRGKLATLQEVGLGYLTLGQAATTLSGGEAQRIKLARELGKRSSGRTLYLLDEPTTGLHFEDIRKLLEVLHRLVDGGSTVVVIEHHLDVIKTADCVIDLGPEGGEGGGRVVGSGTPEEIASLPASHTGQYLRKILDLSG